VGIFEDFKAKIKEGKNKVMEIRKWVEDFKASHEMANQAISTIIEGLPPPFNKFGGIIWNGLEKQVDSDQKMLDTLERIDNNNKVKFMHIGASIDKLFIW
jgi:hypothetical protein